MHSVHYDGISHELRIPLWRAVWWPASERYFLMRGSTAAGSSYQRMEVPFATKEGADAMASVLNEELKAIYAKAVDRMLKAAGMEL
jgi:hypothetical protein